MSVYIKGMEMPTEGEASRLVIITCDGRAIAIDGPHRDVCEAIPVPDHGRLIDADALLNSIAEEYKRYESVKIISRIELETAKTIIPADKEK